ncbi:hypothetical protein FB99_31800 [Pantoea agglomerans]|nr:hypothetical protein FB99_31800 [Pantoea agglomerans]
MQSCYIIGGVVTENARSRSLSDDGKVVGHSGAMISNF